jgi:hypothetical protein
MSFRHIPALLLIEHPHAPGGRLLGARDRACFHAVPAVDAQADQGADLAAELDGLVLREVAEVLHFQLAVGVLVDGQRVDHADRAAGMEPLQFGDDLPVEVGVAEPQRDELYRTNCHFLASFA